MVTVNTITRMVFSSYILCKQNYQGPGKVKSGLLYATDIKHVLGCRVVDSEGHY